MTQTETTLDLTKGPYRRLYSGYLTGQKINEVSWSAECYFWRIHSVVDDFGNYHADPNLLLAATKGRRDYLDPKRKRQKFNAKQVEDWTNELYDGGLLTFYWAKDEKYLHVNGFIGWQPAANRNGRRVQRYPRPEDAGCKTVQTDAKGKSDAHNDQDQDHNQNQDQMICWAVEARSVFELWKTVHKHPKAVFDEKRQRVVIARLKDGIGTKRLFKAVIGCSLSEFHMGKNERSRPGRPVLYNNIELICRDAAHVEKFEAIYERAYGEEFPPPENTPSSGHDEWPVDIASFVQEHFLSGKDQSTVLQLVSATFGQDNVPVAERICTTFAQVRAELNE